MSTITQRKYDAAFFWAGFRALPALVLGVSALLLAACKKEVGSSVDGDQFFTQPGTLVLGDSIPESFPNVDIDGYISYIVPMGHLKLAETEVSVAVQFSSGPKSDSPMFGKSWRSPLLDSVAIPVNETTIEIAMIDGDQLELSRKRGGFAFESEDGQWHCGKFSRDFTLLHKTGAQFKYTGGRLTEILNGPERFAWLYADGKVEVQNEKTGATLLSAVADRNKVKITVGVESNLVFLASGDRFKSLGGVAHVELASGKQIWFDYNKSLGIASLKAKSDQSADLQLIWNATTGLAQRAGDSYYEVAVTKDQGMQIKRENLESKETESFSTFKPGVIRRTLSNGTVELIHYCRAAGPQYAKIERIEEQVNGKRRDTFLADYDPNGKIVRLWRPDEGEYRFEYNPKGGMVLIEQNGKLRFVRSLDDAGRMISYADKLTGIEMGFIYTNGSKVDVVIKDTRKNSQVEMKVEKQSAFLKQINESFEF